MQSLHCLIPKLLFSAAARKCNRERRRNFHCVIESLTNALTKGWTQAFDFKGRMTRSEFWSFVLTSLAFAIFLLGAVAAINERLIWVALGYVATFMVPYVSAIVRRVRDTGKSLWWLLVALIPYIGRYAVWALIGVVIRLLHRA